MRTFNRNILENGVMTSTDVLTSKILDLNTLNLASIQLVWTGTPTGTIKLYSSNDGITFTALTKYNDAISNPAGSAGDLVMEFESSSRYLKAEYTNASGTGVLNVIANLKGNG